MKHNKVLLLSEGFGTGHTQAAHALAASLTLHSTHIEAEVMELGAHQHPVIGPLILNAYRFTLVTQPKLIGKLYHLFEKDIGSFTQLALHRVFYAQSKRIIQEADPDVIVCTHPFPNMIVSRIKQAGLNIPLCTVITDYDGHAAWISSSTDAYLVSTQEVKDDLISRGVNPSIVHVTGMPVHPKFRHSGDKQAIREKFNLKPIPTVLIMGGGWGIMKQAQYVSDMLRWKEQIQFIFCLGNNEKMRDKMQQDPQFQHPHIHLLGYTPDIHELMDVSDLLVTKPGGITCSEGLTKGIPMLLYSPFPGQEERNCHYLVSHGYAEQLDSPEKLHAWIERLLIQCPSLAAHREVMATCQRFEPPLSLQPILQHLQ